ncbi:MAG: hypothetical protein DSY55_01190 [Clostridia bacterium]|nr:MAG: hypothetical protein DSY55_01190 [Clostridia bacterium]
MRKTSVTAIVLIFFAVFIFNSTPSIAAGCDPNNIIFSEIDYDQPGSDHDEFIELFFPNGGTVSDCEIQLVNGNGASKYATIDISGTYTAKQYVAFFHAGIQNGSPDGFALVDTSSTAGTVVWFYSYEGTIAGFDAGDGAFVDSTPLTNNGTAVNDTGNESIVNGPVAGVDDCVDGQPTPNAANQDLASAPTSITIAGMNASSGPSNALIILGLFGISILLFSGFWLRRRLPS